MSYKFKKGRAYVVPHQLIESWWRVLREDGFSVQLDDQPETYPSDPTKSLYYRGAVQAPQGIVTVIAMRGPPAHSKSEAAGKEMILLGYSTPNAGYELDGLDTFALSVGSALIEAGAKELPPPPRQ